MKKVGLIIFISIFILTSVSSFGAVSNTQLYAGETLKQMKILEGYKDGTLKLEANINRAEFATIISRLLGYNTANSITSKSNFSDISSSHWAYNTISISAEKGYIKGYSNGKFMPKSEINFAEAITIMLRILGYNDKSLEGAWPNNYISKAKELNILNNIDTSNPKASITRGDVAVLIVNCLPMTIINK